MSIYMKMMKSVILVLVICIGMCGCSSNSSSSSLEAILDTMGRTNEADKLIKSFGNCVVSENGVSYGSFLRTTIPGLTYKGYSFTTIKVDYSNNVVQKVYLIIKKDKVKEEIQKLIDKGFFIKIASGYICMPEDGAYTITLEETYEIVMMEKVWYYGITISK